MWAFVYGCHVGLERRRRISQRWCSRRPTLDWNIGESSTPTAAERDHTHLQARYPDPSGSLGLPWLDHNIQPSNWMGTAKADWKSYSSVCIPHVQVEASLPMRLYRTTYRLGRGSRSSYCMYCGTVHTHYLTGPTSTPASSNTSRLTASSNDSPGSTNPARHEYIPFGHAFCRPRSILSPVESRIPMMVTWCKRERRVRSTPSAGKIE
jgi:hypothetical protein